MSSTDDAVLIIGQQNRGTVRRPNTQNDTLFVRHDPVGFHLTVRGLLNKFDTAAYPLNQQMQIFAVYAQPIRRNLQISGNVFLIVVTAGINVKPFVNTVRNAAFGSKKTMFISGKVCCKISHCLSFKKLVPYSNGFRLKYSAIVWAMSA